MLYLVLVLVVASLGLLIAALTTANTLWAWISVLISVVAGALLVLDWIQNRRRRSRGAPAADRRPEPERVGEPPAGSSPAEPPPAPPPPPVRATSSSAAADAVSDKEFDESFEAFENQLKATPIEPVERPGPAYEKPVFGEPPFGTNPPEPVTAVQEPVTDLPPEPVTAVQQPVFDPDIEPPEEGTDATDLLVVSELADQVVVIDERPRYHLGSCVWLGNRPVLPLPVSEARELGFTPCALCSPDATLAAQQRARS
ncbi:hypothetical protein GC106_7520 [Kibdelosporangium sp. 4NS15]|uniref:Uncharacterized protein n=1 Tax=Kibdelosporangium persicum TaxID=2698649 RepID=A0ABX2EWX4_9PSEU|nr:hypothetical protein [Kibdelosporangium persicum]NRN63551.1 hypothetical protein [Kibdelosporangium persicum]